MVAIRRYEVRACDRCGFQVEMLAEPQAWAGWASIGASGVGKVVTAATVTGPTAMEPAVPNRADLCPECNEEFVQWWRAKL